MFNRVWGVVCLVVIDPLDVSVAVERELYAVGEFKLPMVVVTFGLDDVLSRIVLTQIGGYRRGKERGGNHRATLAVDLSPLATTVEFDLCAVGENHIVVVVANGVVVLGERERVGGEVGLDEILGPRGELVVTDRSIVCRGANCNRQGSI